MPDNLDDEQKQQLKREDNKKEKAKRDNPNVGEKVQMKIYKKEGKKAMRDNLDDEQKEHYIEDKKRKKANRDNLYV